MYTLYIPYYKDRNGDIHVRFRSDRSIVLNRIHCPVPAGRSKTEPPMTDKDINLLVVVIEGNTPYIMRKVIIWGHSVFVTRGGGAPSQWTRGLLEGGVIESRPL